MGNTAKVVTKLKGKVLKSEPR